jgi:hypothetical protein
MDNKKGLHTLNERIKRLEEHDSLLNEFNDDDLLDVITKKQKMLKKQKLKELQNVYLSNLQSNIENLDKDNFFKIIVFTIQFVEENFDSISQILLTKKSDELLKLICIDLLNHVFPNTFSEMFIENCISGIITIQQTSSHIQQTHSEVQLKKKKSLFSKK